MGDTGLERFYGHALRAQMRLFLRESPLGLHIIATLFENQALFELLPTGLLCNVKVMLSLERSPPTVAPRAARNSVLLGAQCSTLVPLTTAYRTQRPQPLRQLGSLARLWLWPLAKAAPYVAVPNN